jgi:hypothetical protein
MADWDYDFDEEEWTADYQPDNPQKPRGAIRDAANQAAYAANQAGYAMAMVNQLAARADRLLYDLIQQGYVLITCDLFGKEIPIKIHLPGKKK